MIAKCLKDEYKERVDIKFVDEFRTSMLCSFCYSKMDLKSQGKYRYGTCNCTPNNDSAPANEVFPKKSNSLKRKRNEKYEIEQPKLKRQKTIDRDVNACRNIRYKGLNMLGNKQNHKNFDRKTKL